MAEAEQVDTVIIGGGPGGYTAAIRLGQYGQSPVVVERGNIGGVCLNWGCIPTKTLYSTTEPLARLSSWEDRGVKFEGYDFDLERAREHQGEVVDKLTGGVGKLIRANGGEIVHGEARLESGLTVTVEKESGETASLAPEDIIIATGSSPIELPGFPFSEELVWHSRDAVGLPEIPEKLVILGAGVVGLEMGTIYGRLGSEVEIIEMAEGILPGMNLDRRFSSRLSRALKGAGITVHTRTRAERLAEKEEGYVVVGEKSEEEVEFPADRVLSAVGRSPNSRGVLEDVEVELDGSGYIAIDEACRTSLENVYAIGDVAGEPLLAHKAAREGLIAAADIAGEGLSSYRTVPAAVFTDPEYAEVGLSADEAEQGGHETVLGRFPFRASGKALAMDETEGLVQLVVDRESDRLLGGAVLGANASDLIGEIGLAVERNLTAREVAETIHAHPTLSEAVMEAAENAHGQAIHTGNR